MKSFIAFLRGSLLEPAILNNRKAWKSLYAITWLSVFFYVFAESIFFITKVSFMDFMLPMSILSLVLETCLLGFLMTLPVLALTGIALSLRISKQARIIALQIGLLVPSFIIATLCLLLIDNFTYTVFHFGVVNAYGFFRAFYGVVYLLILLLVYRVMASGLKAVSFTMKGNRPFLLINAFILIPLVLLLARTDWDLVFMRNDPIVQAANRPNIIILGSDGLSAKFMSVYGYPKETTPFLDGFSKSSLLGVNAFTNSAKTTGSVLSILTGRLPLETRVLFTPDILHGINEYEHLPGILKEQGYFTEQMAVPYYVDANDVNLRGGFDIVNDQKNQNGFIKATIDKFNVDNMPYYWDVLVERAADRLLHIFFIRDMPFPYNDVTKVVNPESDQRKLDEIIRLINESDQPVFVQAHMMGTHEPYSPSEKVFSAGLDESQASQDEFYEDTILGFDHIVEKLVKSLKESGELDNTILVIYSDHAKDWSDVEKVPLIIHFPNDEYSGVISANVQNVDIAPTLLDYMGLPVPGWMDGASLIDAQLHADRPVISTNLFGFGFDGGELLLISEYNHPPFYQFGYVDIFECQRLTRLDLTEKSWYQTTVNSYASPCNPNSLPALSVTQERVLAELRKSGFDVTSVEGELPVKSIEK